MPREQWPDTIAFMVMSKREGQQKFQAEGEFIADAYDVLGNGSYAEPQAREDADVLLAQLYGAHSGGTKDYIILRCTVHAWETRPVE